MQNLDDIFFSEFNLMMRNLKAINGNSSLNNLIIDDYLLDECIIFKHDKVLINGINEEYYNKLNGTEALLWQRPNLKRRTYDSEGKFIVKNDNYVLQDVTLPHDCSAIVSDYPIGVKTLFKPKESFDFVDFVVSNERGRRVNKFIYIVPKKYCYKINQTALVASYNKLTRAFYSGCSIALADGNTVFLYVIPYKPSNDNKAYRILATGTNPDDLTELCAKLYKSWIDNNLAFNPEICEMFECTKGRSNAAYETFAGRLDSYSFSSDRNLENDIELLEDMEYSDSLSDAVASLD